MSACDTQEPTWTFRGGGAGVVPRMGYYGHDDLGGDGSGGSRWCRARVVNTGRERGATSRTEDPWRLGDSGHDECCDSCED